MNLVQCINIIFISTCSPGFRDGGGEELHSSDSDLDRGAGSEGQGRVSNIPDDKDLQKWSSYSMDRFPQ